jgi:DNA-binding NarL/FixJ family response regulator
METANDCRSPVDTNVDTNKDPIRLVIADDHPVIRDGLKRLLRLESDFEIVGEACDGLEVLEKVYELDPDILLLDLRMPKLHGLSAMRALRQSGARTRIIVLTASDDKKEFVQAMKLGCSGVVRKQSSPDLIAKSIRQVHSGEIWLDADTTAAVLRQFSKPPAENETRPGRRDRERGALSVREREIAALVAEGLKNREIAERMFISEQTVKNHLHSIFEKLSVVDRLELTLHLVHQGLHSGGREGETESEPPVVVSSPLQIQGSV